MDRGPRKMARRVALQAAREGFYFGHLSERYGTSTRVAVPPRERAWAS